MFCTKTCSIFVPGLAASMLVVLMSGCAGIAKVPTAAAESKALAPSAVPQAAAVPSVSTNAAPASAAAPSAPATATAAATTTAGGDIDAKIAPSSPPMKAVVPAAKPAVVPLKAPTTAAPTAPPAPVATQAVSAALAAANAAKPAAPPLDMKSLENRLKQTEAIGVFTKIALKNQVSDLIEQFRAYYAGRLNVNLAALRRPYEMLLQKVLALLQDGDPPLANAIVASREAIWGILADPAKFATI